MDRALFHSEQFPFTQLPQHAIDVDVCETQRVGKNGLAEGALKLGLGRQSDQAQPFGQLHEEMSRALDCIPPPDVDEVFDNHGLIS